MALQEEKGMVVFRRVHGRIVPITIKKKNASLVERGTTPAALIGGGAAVTLGAGALSARLLRESAYAHSAKREAMVWHALEKSRGNVVQAKHAFRVASRSQLESLRFGKAADRIMHGGRLAGAALVAAGVHDALQQTSLKDDKKTTAVVAAGAGLAANFGVRSGFNYFFMKHHPAGKSAAFLEAVRHAAKRVIARGFRI